MNCLKPLFFLLVFLCSATAGNSLAETANIAEAEALIKKIEGVYKYTIENNFVYGGTYKEENILEIVGVSKEAIYFKSKMYFFNGHQCFLFGVARFIGNDSFLFEDDEPSEENSHCELEISYGSDNDTEESEIFFSDKDGHCKEHFLRAEWSPFKPSV